MHLRIYLRRTGTWLQGINAEGVYNSLFPSGKSLKYVAVEFGFALTTEMTLGYVGH